MFMTIVGILDFLLNLIGFAAVFAFFYVFVGLQRKMLAAKKFKFLGYTLSIESHAKKQLKIEITK